MRHPFRYLAVAVLVGFAAVTAFKRHGGEAAASHEAAVTAEARAQTDRFWAALREATAHRLAGRYAEAAAAYERALALNDRHEDARYYLGNVLLALGRYDEAGAAWRRLAEINPTSSRAFAQLGDLYLCYGAATFDLDAAEAAFHEALRVNREETGPLLHLGQVALFRGDHDHARHYFDAVTASNAGSVEAHFFKGYLAWHVGTRPLADTLFAAAVRHAVPEQPVKGVAGEGDTKQGRALTRRAASCQAFERHVAGLAGVAVTPAEVDARYRRLDALLAERRP